MLDSFAELNRRWTIRRCRRPRFAQLRLDAQSTRLGALGWREEMFRARLVSAGSPMGRRYATEPVWNSSYMRLDCAFPASRSANLADTSAPQRECIPPVSENHAAS